MIKKITTFILACLMSITSISKDIKPLNQLKLKSKFSALLDVEIEEINNLDFYYVLNNWLGTKYKYAGNTFNGVDCSGFTKNVYKDVFNVEIPRTSKLQFRAGDEIKKNQLQEGDLVFFITKGKSISHVGIYLQNNKFIHASVSKGVTISDLDESYYKSRFYKAGRI